ncbi:MAG: helix-turn-helix domain-containing protein [Pseudonocardiaceae bacterium]
MNTARSQTVRRRQLGGELRRLRDAAGKSAREAADWAGVSTSTLSKIERGSQAIKTGHVRLLAQLYGIGAPAADTLIRLAREANQRGWWAVHGDTVPDWVRTYLDLEQDASELWAYESGLMFGLFQTPGYAEAVMAAFRPDASPDELAKRVAFRTVRQQRLFGDRAPSLRVVLDEAVLRRVVGGPAVMREQLEHLAEVARLPSVSVQVQPFSAGAHPSIGSAFTLLRFADADTADMNCVYLENAQGGLYLERPIDVDHYAMMFEQLSTSALSADQSLELVTTLTSQLPGERPTGSAP